MNPFETISLEDFVRYAIAVVVIFSALFAVLYTVWGGFLIILSGGNEEKVKKAVNYIRYALIGIVFVVAIIFVFPFFSSLIGLPYGEYAKPAAVFATIQEVGGTIFGAPIGHGDPVPGTNMTLPPDFSQL